MNERGIFGLKKDVKSRIGVFGSAGYPIGDIKSLDTIAVFSMHLSGLTAPGRYTVSSHLLALP